VIEHTSYSVSIANISQHHRRLHIIWWS